VTDRRIVDDSFSADAGLGSVDEQQLLPQLVSHLREHRTKLRQEWEHRIHWAHLLQAMTPQEMANETTSVYDNYVGVLETGSVQALQRYARDLSERIIPRGVETHEVVGIVLLLRDVLARSLFEKYQDNFPLLNQVLDAYEPAANRIANTVAVSFVDERERVIRQQQDAIRELSTPVLPVRERLLILPIIGVLDTERARQLTEQLLLGIRTHRAKVVVIDITGAPDVDESVQLPGWNRGRVPSDGGECDHHRSLSRDRPDVGDDRSRSEQDEHDRRSAGRLGGSRTAAGVPGDP
jgi:rsbT co-antagonist protein RsbR